MNLWVIFLTGLTTGGLSCLAVQGAFLASVVANQKKDELDRQDASGNQRRSFRADLLPVGMFLAAKLVVHAAFGALLGAIGGALSLSFGVRIAFQIAAVLFMLATALNLLNVHPIFRFLSFQPPRFLSRYVRDTAKGRALFTPALLGALTIFIPCGITQAMEVLAITSESALSGALILSSFVLGTAPVFLLVGVTTARLSERFQGAFQRFAAVLLFGMVLWSANGILTALDAPVTAAKVADAVRGNQTTDLPVLTNAPLESEVQRVRIDVYPDGYAPSRFAVRAGVPVELTLVSNEVYTCALEFTLRAYGVDVTLGPTDQKTVTFTPTKKGTFTYSCGMGMYVGTMRVI